MHEVSLAESIAAALLQMQEEHRWKSVVEVRLRIGALRQVFPDILSFAFNTVTRSTALEGARLVVEDVPLSFRCRDCGTSWQEETVLCPSCGSIHRETVAGMELDIESVEVEE
ncbi:hydrogenase maturation nickel metallochaperone HypA [Aminivibrio sp.]|jgi:hydrogenase nickel incorporation protein HypA/HybF|uniref:hydrogenase maturation nickel metallochaperone HypA n=1 Tax=Aminivibrio sp. TaxID=1872489 RepID=UPI001A5C514A|nr:hydrogenase maturation nickel metallochaperone HypA [Aminivibrio sp.]MBL3538538.1 hydrogenase maturation nickel metallochaperone HypA [Aminivibrio sp.]MDK2958093.1 hydrogenase nickel incorporation protein HypA/HybF [Synergistaceae bacterium]